MVCSICLALDFRYLKTWGSRLNDINSSDAVFRNHNLEYPTDEQIKTSIETGYGLPVFYFHYPNAIALIESARGGCHLCAVMVYGLFYEPYFLEQQHDFPLPRTQSDRPVVLCILSVPPKAWQEAPVGEWFHVFCGELHCRLRIVQSPDNHMRQYSQNLESAWMNGELRKHISTWSPLNIKLASDWYRRCNQYHSGCKVGENLLPTRVIDLGEAGSQCQPVLVEPDLNARGSYIILSHCWGNTKFLKISKNCANQWDLPPLLDWPQTFQDAVEVSRSFQIRYLWIDAICILQGAENRLDWEVESGKMATYFRNARFTIAAKFAASGSDGLFATRNPIISFPCRVELSGCQKGNLPGSIYVCCEADDQGWIDNEDTVEKSPLHTRGWVLQEQILSPRALEFGRRGIYWKCFCTQQRGWSERYMGEIKNVNHGPEDNPRLRDLVHSDTRFIRNRNRYYDSWYMIVNEFNGRNIKYQNDILPSLSGIAETILPFLDGDDQYLAGVWKNDLAVGLLWYVGAFHYGRVEPQLQQLNYDRKNFSTPSWSWVSLAQKRILIGLHSTILYPGGIHGRGIPSTRLISSHMTLGNAAAPYGEVRSGILNFISKCVRVTIFCHEDAELDYETKKHESPELPSASVIFPKRMEISYPPGLTVNFRREQGHALLDDTETYAKQPDRQRDNFLQPIRPEATINAVFLPLLSHDGKTMGILLRPQQFRDQNTKPKGLLLTTICRLANFVGSTFSTGLMTPYGQEHPPEDKLYYRRVGRGTINMNETEWVRTDIADEEINIV